jgi:hypothetical protein
VNYDDELNSLSFLNVLVALILFLESNGDQSISVKILKSLLEHYNILNTN